MVSPAVSTLVSPRRVEDLVTFWCSDGSDQLDTTRGAIQREVQQQIAEHYDNIEALETYIRAYTDWNMFDTLWDKNNQPRYVEFLEIMDELLAFPWRMGMDPVAPETAAWARFFVPYRAGGTYARRERLHWRGVAELWKAGVPLEYARALDTPTWNTQMPVRRVIRLYREGISAEYAYELLYGAKA